ncbi:MAG: hypothetical protein ACLSST_10000 [Bifidobacterium dentium]
MDKAQQDALKKAAASSRQLVENGMIAASALVRREFLVDELGAVIRRRS